MKIKLIPFLIVYLIGYSVNSYAVCGTTACIGVIETVYYTNSGTVYIGTDGDENALNCSAVAGVYVSLLQSNPYQKQIFATLLSAKVAQESVVVRIKEGTSNCEIDWVRLDPPAS